MQIRDTKLTTEDILRLALKGTKSAETLEQWINARKKKAGL